MSYKTELQLNNAELEQILESILALPDAGSTDPVVEKDVNFYDYDGELLYSYTLAEAQVLTELPPAPTPKKDFIVFDEWNWTLEQIKSLNLPIDVGATYKTVDDKTYLVIEVTEPERMEVTLNYMQWCGSIKVDWGDGSAEEETLEDSSNRNVTKKHTYSSLGRYIISINANGTWNAGQNKATAPIIGTGSNDILSGAFLIEAYAGKGIRFTNDAFHKAIRLRTIMFSRQVTISTSWYSSFMECFDLKAVIFPSNCAGVGGSFMYDCYNISIMSLPYLMTQASSFYGSQIKRFTAGPNLKTFSLGLNRSLQKIWIAEGVEDIGNACFTQNSSLSSIALPSSIKTIGSQVFYNCTTLTRIRFASANPPAVANANAFTGIPTSCIVEVPAASLAAYQATTNYGTIAAQMVGV